MAVRSSSISSSGFNAVSGRYHVGVFYAPIRHFIVKPETIDTYSNQGEEPPFYVIAEELCSRPVEIEAMAVDDRIAAEPALEHDIAPRIGNA